MFSTLWRPISRFFGGKINTMELSAISVHRHSDNPTRAWSELQVKQKVEKVKPIPKDTPIQETHLRCVCISDTHTKIEIHPEMIPPGDILIHGGDFTNKGCPKEVKTFNEFIGSLPHQVKVVIAGNHDMSLDDDMVKNNRDYLKRNFGISHDVLEKKNEEYGVSSAKELLTSFVYLEDAGIDICGIKFYGSPWQPEFCGWGFNLPRGEPCLEKWNMIPDDTDILITHGPPIGHGDACFDGNRAGCVELLTTVQKRVKPKYHIFGHIHEGYGMTTDGITNYVNASTCTLRYKPANDPIVFDIAIPEGHSKEELLKIKPKRLIRGSL